jgi:RHS repeat-associated protein
VAVDFLGIERMSARMLSLLRRVPFLGLFPAALLCPAPVEAADVVEYYHLDAVGNVRAVTDQARNVIERHDYLPFGEEWCGTQVCGSAIAGQPKRFTGKERDQETGLDYFGGRYYGSKVGRFTTVDPAYVLQENLIDPQRWNKYTYARNNPLRYNDPDGRLIDIIADAGFIAYDLIDIGVTRFTGGEVSGTQKAALAADIAAAAIPFATGAGIAVRAASRTEHAVEAARAVEAGTSVVTRERRLAELAEHANVSAADRGWIKSEMRQVETGNRTTIRNPPGKDLRHPPGRARSQGYDYAETQLQDRATHRTQHRYLQERSTGTTVRRPTTPPNPGPKLPE